MAIDLTQVKHLARLASLGLTDEEADRFTGELSAIVRYVEELDRLDTSSVEPTIGGCPLGMTRSGTGSGTVLREDEIEPSLSRDEVLAEAPGSEGDGFSVPAFVES